MAKDVGRAPSGARHVCPVCKQPVQAVIKRRKILGAFVPIWVAGPCHNPNCEAREGAGPSDAHTEEGPPAEESPESSQEPPENPAAQS